MVRDFMEKFGQKVDNKLGETPSLEVRRLRAKLILEEALECIKALGFDTMGYCLDEHTKVNIEDVLFEELYEFNLVDLLDGLADLHYVGYCGTAVAVGIGNNQLMDKIFGEVHNSNMSKLWTYTECMKGSLFNSTIWNVKKNGAFSISEVRDYVITDKDGKVIKSPSYTPVNIKDLIAPLI